MNILADGSLRLRLSGAFPKAFVNMHNEFIVYPPRNIYFRLDGVASELELKCKVLEWCSREAHKSISRPSKKYHFEGINKFLGTSFSHEDMAIIYTYLGNNVNRSLAIKFIESGYDVSVLKPKAIVPTESTQAVS